MAHPYDPVEGAGILLLPEDPGEGIAPIVPDQRAPGSYGQYPIAVGKPAAFAAPDAGPFSVGIDFSQGPGVIPAQMPGNVRGPGVPLQPARQANIYDQFDGPMRQANVYDQFDEPVSLSNVYDRFHLPSAQPNIYDQFDLPIDQANFAGVPEQAPLGVIGDREPPMEVAPRPKPIQENQAGFTPSGGMEKAPEAESGAGRQSGKPGGAGLSPEAALALDVFGLGRWLDPRILDGSVRLGPQGWEAVPGRPFKAERPPDGRNLTFRGRGEVAQENPLSDAEVPADGIDKLEEDEPVRQLNVYDQFEAPPARPNIYDQFHVVPSAPTSAHEQLGREENWTREQWESALEAELLQQPFRGCQAPSAQLPSPSRSLKPSLDSLERESLKGVATPVGFPYAPNGPAIAEGLQILGNRASEAVKLVGGGIAQGTLRTGQGLFTQAREIMDDPRRYLSRQDAANYSFYLQTLDALESMEPRNENSFFPQEAIDGAKADTQKILDELRAKAEKLKQGTTKQFVAQGYRDIANQFEGWKREYADFYQVSPEFQNSLMGEFLQAVGEMVPQSVAAAMPGVGLAALQSQQFQSAWDEAKETAERQGVPFDREKAYRYALSTSITSAALDRAGFDGSFRKWIEAGGDTVLKRLSKRVLAGAGSGAGTEVMEGGFDDVAATMSGIGNRNPFDLGQRGKDLLFGASLGGGMAGLAGGSEEAGRYNSFEQKVDRIANGIRAQVEFPNGMGHWIIAGPSAVGPRSDAWSASNNSSVAARFAKALGSYAELGRKWMELARDEETASLGETPVETDFPSIIKKLAGPIAEDISMEEHKLPNGETWGYTLKDPEGHITLSLLPGNQVEVNSQFAGEHSTPIYQAIFAWAHNNGKKVIEDESGLSRVAKLRRTSQMFSSALRYGTTRHMEPGPDSGIRGWLPEDMPEATEHNIGLLAAREAELVRERLRPLEGMRYDLDQGSFYDSERRIPDDKAPEYLQARIAEIDPDFTHGVGNRTLRRALATLAAQRAGEQVRPGQLVGPTAKAPEALKRVRYSRAEGRHVTAGPLGPAKPAGIRAKLLGEIRGETPGRAVDWLRMFRAIAPGAARKLELQIAGRYEAARRIAGIESVLSGRPVDFDIPPEAHAAIHRDTIYLFQEALEEYRRNGNERSEGIRRIQHEVTHKWWDALSSKERNALRRLWRAETEAKVGPLYDAEGRLKPGVMAGVEADVQEWFAERGTMANSDWAEKRAAIADHDGSLVGRLAAELRGWLFDARQTIAPNLSRDVIADELRGVLRRGTGAKAAVDPRFAKIGQQLREADRTMVEDETLIPLLDLRKSNEEIAEQSAFVIKAWPATVIAADGTGVDLNVADGGSIGRRAFHLIRDTAANRIDPSKAAWLAHVPETLQKAQVRVVDLQEHSVIYVRKYEGGINHAVVVRPDGKVESQKAFVGHLETQFPIWTVNDPRSRTKYLKVDWVRPDLLD